MSKIVLHIYTRVSTSIQEEDGTSLKTQKESGIELASKLGMSFEIHNEGGTSSAKDTLDNRPVLINILKLMDDGVIKNLYVWNTDRLSRNQITWYTIRQKMVKNEVVLYTSNGIHKTTDFMENMVLGILSEVSQYENKVRAERSRLGKIEKVKLNYWRGGAPPFGYKLNWDGRGNKLSENENESKWIRFIFSEYSNGTTLKDIKSTLENNYVHTRRGNEFWSMGSLQAILNNDIYIGKDQYVDKKTKQIILNEIPQIVSSKLWKDVQDRKNLLLKRKNQINRTKRFYLFRDFLICKCGTPIGGRVKTEKKIEHYYCPLNERQFNNSYKKSITCRMKRCMNIPATDLVLWNKIVDILSDTITLKENLKKKTVLGINLSSKAIQQEFKVKSLKIEELKTLKLTIEKGLVDVEANHLLSKYPSERIYESLKQELTNRYNKTKSDIEDLNNSIKEISNHNKWFEWIDEFGSLIRANRDLPERKKKQVLKTLVDYITVDYDSTENVHRLLVHFKIPVFQRVDSKEKHIGNQYFLSNQLKSLVKSLDQNSAVETYSTVINTSPITPMNIIPSQGFSLLFSLQITSANFWLPPYSTYQQELFDIICKFREQDGWDFKQISDWLNDHQYLTPRGHAFQAKHAWSIYQKKKRSIKRFSRVYDDTISDMKIDVVDYVPVTNE